jgi:hypothetical protein
MLYDLVDATLDRHRDLFSVAVVQPTLAEAGAELARRAAWQAALDGRRVTAFLQDGQVHVRSTEPVQVPVTGTVNVSERSGWTETIDPQDDGVVLALA